MADTQGAHVVEDGDILRVRSSVPLLGGSSLEVESSWVVDPAAGCIRHVRTVLTLGPHTLDIGRTYTPVTHMGALKAYVVRQHGPSVVECGPDLGALRARETVFLATRRDTLEVFLDRESAVSWAGSRRRVKQVSIEAAKCALKTDRETVLTSAAEASMREHDRMRLLKGIAQLVGTTCPADTMSDEASG